MYSANHLSPAINAQITKVPTKIAIINNTNDIRRYIESDFVIVVEIIHEMVADARRMAIAIMVPGMLFGLL